MVTERDELQRWGPDQKLIGPERSRLTVETGKNNPIGKKRVAAPEQKTLNLGSRYHVRGAT